MTASPQRVRVLKPLRRNAPPLAPRAVTAPRSAVVSLLADISATPPPEPALHHRPVHHDLGCSATGLWHDPPHANSALLRTSRGLCPPERRRDRWTQRMPRPHRHWTRTGRATWPADHRRHRQRQDDHLLLTPATSRGDSRRDFNDQRPTLITGLRTLPTVILVGHAETVEISFNALGLLPVHRPFDLKVPPASITEWVTDQDPTQWPPPRWTLVRFNETRRSSQCE